MKKWLERYGFYLLFLVIISEVLGPMILAPFDPDYDSLTMVISLLGKVGAPTRLYFNTWQIMDGTLFLLAAPAIYHRFFSTSPVLAKLITLSVVLYSVGDCIFTGIFSEIPSGQPETLISMFHKGGSGVGFVALLVGIILLVLLARREQRLVLSNWLALLFFVAMMCMAIYSSENLPLLDHLMLTNRGLWQRMTLFLLYLPLLILALENFNYEQKQYHLAVLVLR